MTTEPVDVGVRLAQRDAWLRSYYEDRARRRRRQQRTCQVVAVVTAGIGLALLSHWLRREVLTFRHPASAGSTA